MAGASGAKTKAESDGRASLQHPLRSPALAGFTYDVGLAQLGQSLFVSVRADPASPVDILDAGFRSGGATPGQNE